MVPGKICAFARVKKGTLRTSVWGGLRELSTHVSTTELRHTSSWWVVAIPLHITTTCVLHRQTLSASWPLQHETPGVT